MKNYSVGDILKSTRLDKNLSLDLVSKELNISTNVLEKLENDKILQDYNIIFYIGHLRSYCSFLDLDADLISKKFKIQISFTKSDLSEKIAKPAFQNKSLNIYKFLPLSLIVIIFTSFYILFVKENNSELQYALIPDLPESYNAVIEKAELHAAQNKIDPDNNKSKLHIDEFNYSSALASNKTEDYKENDFITLKILNSTWLQLRDESNNIILSQLMEKGDEYSYKMNLNYNITAGNAGNILVVINNDIKGKIGSYGEVVDSIILDYNFKN